MKPLLWLVGPLVAAGLVTLTANTPAITLTVDCPACGPGQAVPHDCPRGVFAPSLAAPDPLPALLESALTHHRRFVAIEGFSLPPLGEPRSLTELDHALTDLLAAARTQIERVEREQASVARIAATATAEAQHLTARLVELTTSLAQTKDRLAALPSQIATEQREAVAARDEFLSWQKTHTALREQIRQTRNRLFPRLHQAAQRGWILPPSSYRELPAPLPARTRATPRERIAAETQLAPIARFGPPGESSSFTLPRDALSLPSADGRLDAVAAESSVRAKLSEFAAVQARANAVAAVHAEAQRAGAAARDNTASLTVQIARLEPALAALTAQNTELDRQLSHAHQIASTERARRNDMCQRALLAWVEGGLYRFLDHQAESVMTPLLAEGPDAARLGALRSVAETTAQLGADPAALIARLPRDLASRGETLADVVRELDALRAMPELAFTSTVSLADVPASLRPYWSEARP